jgi:hypothetical protein
MSIAYSLTIIHGLLTLLAPSSYVQSVLGVGIVYFYGSSFLLGGAVGLYSILKPNFKIEGFVLWPLSGAYGLYAIALWVLFASETAGLHGPRQPYALLDLSPAYGPALVSTLACALMAWKALYLAGVTEHYVREAVIAKNARSI